MFSGVNRFLPFPGLCGNESIDAFLFIWTDTPQTLEEIIQGTTIFKYLVFL